jgi:hypothetical protein
MISCAFSGSAPAKCGGSWGGGPPLMGGGGPAGMGGGGPRKFGITGAFRSRGSRLRGSRPPRISSPNPPGLMSGLKPGMSTGGGRGSMPMSCILAFIMSSGRFMRPADGMATGGGRTGTPTGGMGGVVLWSIVTAVSGSTILNSTVTNMKYRIEP